jgi:hypothetical protein
VKFDIILQLPGFQWAGKCTKFVGGSIVFGYTEILKPFLENKSLPHITRIRILAGNDLAGVDSGGH